MEGMSCAAFDLSYKRVWLEGGANGVVQWLNCALMPIEHAIRLVDDISNWSMTMEVAQMRYSSNQREYNLVANFCLKGHHLAETTSFICNHTCLYSSLKICKYVLD